MLLYSQPGLGVRQIGFLSPMTTGLTGLPTLPQGACARFTDAVATAHAQDATTGVFPDPAPATTSGTGPATPASSRASRRTRRRNPPGMVGGTILVRSSPPARPPLRRPANRSHQPQHGTDGGRVIAERRPRPGQPRRDLSPNTSSTIHAEHDLNKTPPAARMPPGAADPERRRHRPQAGCRIHRSACSASGEETTHPRGSSPGPTPHDRAGSVGGRPSTAHTDVAVSTPPSSQSVDAAALRR